ncbi:uncharacterized protein [Arachis hypogaea]|uniref:uncharacterized protein n=1 Tax=Arachis hypogaea TaxID=3818 RepID=UPI003B21BECC
MIPIEVSQSSLRTQATNHDQAWSAELDLAEEIRDIAAVRHRALQHQLARRHARKVVPRGFHIGDLVLRKTEQARRPSTHGKLAATWDGPYRICEVVGKGAYKLERLDGNKISSTWNVVTELSDHNDLLRKGCQPHNQVALFNHECTTFKHYRMLK